MDDQATPLLLEAAEFVAAESPSAFWSLVERADATLNLLPAPLTAEEQVSLSV